MTEDERINKAVREATDILRKAAPDAPFILVHVAGKKKNYGARRFGGTAKDIYNAIPNTMVYAAMHCADALNSMMEKVAKTAPLAKEEIRPTPEVAVALMFEAMAIIKGKVDLDK